jgi:tetratricopeptide (TPR) repeat protein
VATVARLNGARRKLYLAAGGVGVVVLAAVGVVVFAVGGKRQAGSDQKPAPVRAVLESDKAAAPTPPAAVEKPALPAAAVEPAEPQPAAAEKPQPAAERKPAAAEKVAAPAEKPAKPEKAALAPSPAAEKPRPVEKKVTAEKPAPAERHVSAKPVASPKPAVEKPVAEKVRAPSEPAPPPEKKQAEAPAPVAQPAINRTQEVAEAYQRGNAKLLNGALPEAIAAFSQALKLNPKDAQSQRGLGMAYAQSGNAAQAVRHFKLYLKALPSAPDRALIEKRIAQLGGR